MTRQVSIHIEVSGLDEAIAGMRRVGKLGMRTTGKFEALLEEMFAHTQQQVHVISGRLKASGYTESDLDRNTWSGSINYGGGPGTKAYYAIYELQRPGTRPDGTPHDFFLGLSSYDDDFEDIIDDHFRHSFRVSK